MKTTEYIHYDALGLAELVRKGEIHPRELAALAIERIEALNPRLNAIVERTFEEVLDTAEEPLPQGPFTGVPYLLKDMIPRKGIPLSLGSAGIKRLRFVPTKSHEVVVRSENAGLLVMGTTNASEFGLLPVTEPCGFGATHNPWNLEHSPGGSSGGTGAAVAAGIVPMAHGNDGGGSIRIPASCCGLFGLKPSRGRNPSGPEALPSGLAVEHCLSRSVRDSAALLDITRGPLLSDHFWAPLPERPYLEEVECDPKPLRIGFSTHDIKGRAAHPDCVAAVKDAAQLCEDLGHHVEEASPHIDPERFFNAFVLLWESMAGQFFLTMLREARANQIVDRLTRTLGEERTLAGIIRALSFSPIPLFETITCEGALRGAKHRHVDVSAAMVDLQRASFYLAHFFEVYDLWLTPTLAEPPLRTGSLASRDYATIKEKVLNYAPYTPIANSSGVPAMSVPLHWNAMGLPIGVHFIARFGDESTLLQLAGQLERARPWFDKRPNHKVR